MIVIHVIGFIGILTVLWVMGDKTPAEKTFTEFTDYSGWGSVGLATIIGSLAPSGALLGADCAAHLAEELKDASWVLPRSMLVTAAANYSFTFIMVISKFQQNRVILNKLTSPPNSILDRQRGHRGSASRYKLRAALRPDSLQRHTINRRRNRTYLPSLRAAGLRHH